MLLPKQWGTEPSCLVEGSHSTGQGSVLDGQLMGQPASQTAQCGPAGAALGSSVLGSKSPSGLQKNAFPLPGGITWPWGSGSTPTS